MSRVSACDIVVDLPVLDDCATDQRLGRVLATAATPTVCTFHNTPNPHRAHVILQRLPRNLPAQVPDKHPSAGNTTHPTPVLAAIAAIFPDQDRATHELGFAQLANRVTRLHISRIRPINQTNQSDQSIRPINREEGRKIGRLPVCALQSLSASKTVAPTLHFKTTFISALNSTYKTGAEMACTAYVGCTYNLVPTTGALFSVRVDQVHNKERTAH